MNISGEYDDPVDLNLLSTSLMEHHIDSFVLLQLLLLLPLSVYNCIENSLLATFCILTFSYISLR